MGKALLWLSFIATATLLLFGTLDAASPVMWLASVSTPFTLLRVGMLITLMALIVTNPPRNNLFRLIVGMFAMSLAFWGLSATYGNQMKFLDTMTILSFSICCGVTVLELDESKLSRVPALGMRRLTASLYAAYTLRSGKL